MSSSTEPLIPAGFRNTMGDARFRQGERVECILVADRGGTTYLVPVQGVIGCIHQENSRVNPIDIEYVDSVQGRAHAHAPPPYLLDPSVAGDMRVIGYDVVLSSPLPWDFSSIPPYYLPRGIGPSHPLHPLNPHNVLCATGLSLYIPYRHVICSSVAPESYTQMSMILNWFQLRAPYGWLVLYHACVPAVASPSSSTTTETNVSDSSETSPGQDRNGTEKVLAQVTILKRAPPLTDSRKPTNQSATKEQKTRRIIGEVVDFGIDYDGSMQLICRPPHSHAAKGVREVGLDTYMFHGAFGEVARTYCHDMLFKLPYALIHDAYDVPLLGPMTYASVLKHLVCDTLQRFRVKTVKHTLSSLVLSVGRQKVPGTEAKEVDSSVSTVEGSEKVGEVSSNMADGSSGTVEVSSDTVEGKRRHAPRGRGPVKLSLQESGNDFYYGFTECGFHFAKTNRRILETAIPKSARPHPEDPECELRDLFFHHKWLNLALFGPRSAKFKGRNTPRASRPSEGDLGPDVVRRGYIIYGRIREGDAEGKSTLDWCTPPPGFDLLRVYLGKGPC